MPIFDFKCEECGNEVEKSMVWTKTMCDEIEPCECGKMAWRRLITVSRGKFAEEKGDLATRQANEMMTGKGWT
jgi:putative FmdB family regulatory protein